MPDELAKYDPATDPVISMPNFLAMCRKMRIDSKRLGHCQLVPLSVQRILIEQILEGLRAGIHFFVVLKCLDPSTKVLTADLRWVPIGTVNEGDQLVGFDEESPRSKRRLRPAEVKKVWRKVDHAIRIEFDDGRHIVAGPEHQHLIQQPGGVESIWRRTDRLRPGDKIRTVVKPWEESSFEDGWAGGFIDGEGSVHCRESQGSRVSVYQRQGETMDRYRRYLASRGIDFYTATDKRQGYTGNIGKQGSVPVELTAVGNIAGCLKLIGMTRPTRFVSQPWWSGKALGSKGKSWSTIKSVEYLDMRELVDIETSTGTFIAEGTCQHNCRQSGTTTIVLAFLLYWLMRHEGMTGMFAIDDQDKKTFQNLAFRKMYGSLKDAGDEWCVPLLQERRELVAFQNGSALAFDNANKRQKGNLGRSIGMNLFFGDEVGFWTDEDALLSLMASLDDVNRNRLYIFGSTAKSFNLFYKLWTKAQGASSVKPIFLGWWLHDWYRIERDDQLGRFDRYWDGQLLPEEEEWVVAVKERYHFDITPEQIAWWRWKLDAEFMDNLPALYQEYPPLPEYAFQYGGSTFFDPEILRKTTIELNRPDNTYKPQFFRFQFGKNLLDTTVSRCDNRPGIYHLAVFEPPRAGEGVIYSMGVDPAFGMTEKSDYACIQLLRCYEDGLEQVAEFAASGLSSMHLAWAVLYLFGAYHIVEGETNVIWNTEIQGGGAAVINIVEQIQQDIGGFYDKLGTHFDSMRAFQYKRVDSLSPNYTAKHWSTNQVNKDAFLHHIKSLYESDRLKLRSLNLIGEMSMMVRDPSGFISSTDGRHDDLVMALGIAVMNYFDPIRYDLEGTGHTFAKWDQERQILLNGASENDLITMRIQGWMNDKRDAYKDREQELREIIETDRA